MGLLFYVLSCLLTAYPLLLGSYIIAGLCFDFNSLNFLFRVSSGRVLNRKYPNVTSGGSVAGKL